MFEITARRMVEIIHDCMEEIVQPGDTVCDCTMGNGHDTLKLCTLVGNEGKVYSFDIQQEAVDRTGKLLAENHVDHIAQLILDSHSRLLQYISEPVKFFVFNLGYLPDGDPEIITRGDSTVKALEDILSLIPAGGGGAVLSYYGHHGGLSEKTMVEEFLQNLPPKYFSVMKVETFNRKNTPPVLYLVKRVKDNR
ncbi:MAG: class I SAM-dependent methyltransferase [Coprococcus sp.]